MCRAVALIRLAVIATIMLLSTANAADFPPPGELPIRPELPDPLVMLDGSKVTTRSDWETKRKPELKALFQHYMYGRLPPTPSV